MFQYLNKQFSMTNLHINHNPHICVDTLVGSYEAGSSLYAIQNFLKMHLAVLPNITLLGVHEINSSPRI